MQTAYLSPFLRIARLHRLVGGWLLLFPSLWGLALASPSYPPLFEIFLFTAGALLMRSAGCVYNDIIDRDFDQRVERTRSRPLAEGSVSLNGALLFFIFLLSLSAVILFSLPWKVVGVGFFALALVLVYPWMKRLTYWPQVFLGITFNIGILMGWFALQEELTLVPLCYYAGGVLWTLGYDTIYAFQDRDDDILIGVKSAALVVSSYPKLFLSFVYSGTLIFWGLGGKLAHMGSVYWIFLVGLAVHFVWQINTLEIDNKENCQYRFTANIYIGLLMFLSIVFSHVID